jgi:hypothetical protein
VEVTTAAAGVDVDVVAVAAGLVLVVAVPGATVGVEIVGTGIMDAVPAMGAAEVAAGITAASFEREQAGKTRVTNSIANDAAAPNFNIL